jgi:hypothetical protein
MERETIHELGLSSSLRAKTPSIPNAPGVDIAALTAGDAAPVFVTLKLAEVGRVSKNGLLYDDLLVDAIVEQINQKRPGGIFGHIKPEDRSTAFPIPHGLWVGAVKDGKTAWGKAYIRDKQAAEYVRHLQAVKGKLGTSIFGTGIPVEVEEGVKRLTDFTLEQLDFAPPERASLQMDSELTLTTEMENGDPTVNQDELKSFIQQMSDDDLMACVGDDRVGTIAEQWMKKKKKKMVAAEFVSEISDADRTQIAELNAQNAAQARELTILRQRVAEYEAREFDEGLDALVLKAIDWKTLDAKQEKRVNGLRKQLRKAVIEELDGRQDLSFANAKIAEIMQSEDFLAVAEAVRDSLAGGAAIVGGAGKSEKERLMEAGRETLSKMGIRSKGGA